MAMTQKQQVALDKARAKRIAARERLQLWHALNAGPRIPRTNAEREQDAKIRILAHFNALPLQKLRAIHKAAEQAFSR